MTKFLIIIVLILAVFAIAQLARVYELSLSIRNKREEDISHANNRLNARLMIVFMIAFYAFFAWLFFAYKDELLPPAASLHGETVDWLMSLNMWLVTGVFFFTNTILFVFAAKYYYREDRKAVFFPHNNTLELVWTVIPTIVLAIVIILGLKAWNEITEPASEDALVIELYSKQFDWTARYAGTDNKLGNSNMNFISGTNPLGVITTETKAATLVELDETIKGYKAKLADEALPDSKRDELEHKLFNIETRKRRVLENQPSPDELKQGYDDVVVKGEFHLPVGKEVSFVFRSQDVIHSAYMPHFRAQMNTVPGTRTTFRFTPTITTAEMREMTGKEEFNYVLLCNKICGSAHYNMQMDIVVETEEEYNAWLASQNNFGASLTASAE